MKKKEKAELVCIGVIILLTISVLLIQDRKVKQEKNDWIARPDVGTREQAIILQTGDAEEQITITVGERERAEEEIKQAFERTLDILKESYMLSEKEKIVWVASVSLPRYISETGVGIRWESSDETVLTNEGEINRYVAKSGQELYLKAWLSYGENMQEVWFPIEVLPYEEGSTEKLLYHAAEALTQLEKETSGAEGFYLPVRIGEVSVRLPKQSVSVFGILAGVGIFVPLLIVLVKRQEKEKIKKRREDELLAAYPRLITKLTLYTGAGLSLRGAWERIGAEQREKPKGKKGVLAEELVQLSGELLNGESELRAYEAFGNRIGIKQYMRLSSLMISHLQKGSGGLWKNLEQEVRSAWELHREHAAKKGEEAQTKLLFPMMGMLFLVMAVVLVPAFFSM